MFCKIICISKKDIGLDYLGGQILTNLSASTFPAVGL